MVSDILTPKRAKVYNYSCAIVLIRKKLKMSKINNNRISCFTIGHSNYAIEAFLRLLEKYAINCLVDIRSSPYSRYVPQFNRENLLRSLEKEKILYVYMGDKLGGRYMDPDLLYSDGVVDYGKVMQKKEFRQGIQSVIRNIKKGLNIVLMCAEKDPLDCHRFLLVSKGLSDQGVRVKHILGNGDFIVHKDLEDLLVQRYNNELNQLSFFEENLSPGKILEKAYKKRNREVAFIVNDKN